MATFTLTYHIIKVNLPDNASVLDKFFRRTVTTEIEAENEQDARDVLAQRIEQDYPPDAYKAINVEKVEMSW